MIKPKKNVENNAVCEVCGRHFYASRPNAAKYHSASCKSAAYRSRKNTETRAKNFRPTPDEDIDLRRLGVCSPLAEQNLRALLTMHGRAVFVPALDAVWDAIVMCGGMVR